MIFENEAQFEEAVIKNLENSGWNDSGGVLKNPNEQDLLNNWANILFENNRGIDRLNDCRLTDGEMRQIIEQVTRLKTPMKLNGFINGKTVSVKRDNPEDKLHYGKEISLKIYDRREIAAGSSRYQIAQQPRFTTSSTMRGNRRGDLLLLINGMPVIHIELKASNISVKQACRQIERYSDEGVFSKLFSLIQIFVAMTPDETLYFANPGSQGLFDSNYQFHWADFNNEPLNDWQTITSSLLSIPMAHQLIGFYTIADESDGALKVMRSYQYYAASAISDKVSKTKWGEQGSHGGFVWHTTGSGKTMTSFKSAQLIANSKDADKVIFLIDRIELGTQSLKEYRSFAEESESIQETEDTQVLKNKLKDADPSNTLIVTSIQKMSRIREEDSGMSSRDIEEINKKRLVFIVDECHRSTFGNMLATIKETFPNAIFFGFTGTPIQEENQKNNATTSMVFGDELHRYSIADGIRDGNVLGFDPYMVSTYKDEEMREAVALEKAKAETPTEAMSDPNKSETFYYYMDSSKVGMANSINKAGQEIKGIEHVVPKSQYSCEQHRNCVVQDIRDSWDIKSRCGKFHAIFATSSIPEAIEYYRLIKEKAPSLKVTALFDSSIDNSDGVIFKEEGLEEIIQDYNSLYGKEFLIATHAKMKKDIAARLAHKKPYLGLEKTPEKQLDLLIVVDQMLTGFDSKWVNTLYMDKLMTYENVIQAFSRTNRLFNPKNEKPFGTIRFYRKPHTMQKNIDAAVKLYSGDRPLALFASSLSENLCEINRLHKEIKSLFKVAGVEDLSRLPEEKEVRAKFAKAYKELVDLVDSSRIQGFSWNKTEYETTQDDGPIEEILVEIDERTYLTFALRYKELATEREIPDEDAGLPEEAPYDIDSYITSIDTGQIDADYMNLNFTKWLKALEQENLSPEALEQLKLELHRSFATLTQEEQKHANIFLHDVEAKRIELEPHMSLRDYITQYQATAETSRLNKLIEALGIDKQMLQDLLTVEVTESNINEYGRFANLCSTADRAKARAFFEEREGTPLSPPKVAMRIDKFLRDFILQGGFDID